MHGDHVPEIPENSFLIASSSSTQVEGYLLDNRLLGL